MRYHMITFGYSLSGQSPAEADLNLLETARRCELYGVKMHPAKVSLFYLMNHLPLVMNVDICSGS